MASNKANDGQAARVFSPVGNVDCADRYARQPRWNAESLPKDKGLERILIFDFP